jgi:hypothetical protein
MWLWIGAAVFVVIALGGLACAIQLVGSAPMNEESRHEQTDRSGFRRGSR